jgi:hypothetical protein
MTAVLKLDTIPMRNCSSSKEGASHACGRPGEEGRNGGQEARRVDLTRQVDQAP